MKSPCSFPVLLSVARFLLESRELERVVSPTLADAMYEQPPAGGHRRWLWQTRVHLLAAIAFGAWEGVLRRLRGASHTPLLLLVLAGVAGAIAGRDTSTLSSHYVAHLVFVGLGLLAAEFIMAAPVTVLRAVFWPGIVSLGVGLAVCPWQGTAFEGRRQWLEVGALTIHVSSLFLPLFALMAARMAVQGRRKLLGLFALGCLGLLALQPDWVAMAAYGSVVGVALLRPRRAQALWLLWLVLGTAAAGVLWSLASTMPAGWALASLLLLLCALFSGVLELVLRQDIDPARGVVVAVALLAPVALRAWSRDSLPVVGYGGSATVAAFLLAAAQNRSRAAECGL